MIIAQLTDIHIGFDPHDPEEANVVRLRAVLARLAGRPNAPDLMVLSGDIADRGDAASYARCAELLEGVRCPVLPLAGNHDARAPLLAAFPQAGPLAEGFLHSVVDLPGLRVVLLDTLEDGRHGGAFCEVRARWLAERLDERPELPIVIFMHHPPFASGIGWMDPDPGEAWIARLAGVLQGRHARVRAIHCGHLPRVVATRFCDIPVHVGPSVAPPVALDLSALDPAEPDGRALITGEPPAYALHRWDGEQLVTHYEYVGDWPVLARYTPTLQPMVRAMMAERGS